MELLDEEGVSPGPPLDRLGEGGRRGFVEPGAGKRGGLLGGQPGQRDALEAALPAQVAEQRMQGLVAGVVAQRGGHEQRGGRNGPDRVREHPDRRRVGPLQVVDDEQHRRPLSRVRDRRGDSLEQPVAGVLGLALGCRGSGL